MLVDIWVGWVSSFAVSWDYRRDKNERTYGATVGHKSTVIAALNWRFWVHIVWFAFAHKIA